MSDLDLTQIRDMITHNPHHAQEFAPLLIAEVERLKSAMADQDQLIRDLTQANNLLADDADSEKRNADRCERELDSLHRQHELPRDRRYYE